MGAIISANEQKKTNPLEHKIPNITTPQKKKIVKHGNITSAKKFCPQIGVTHNKTMKEN